VYHSGIRNDYAPSSRTGLSGEFLELKNSFHRTLSAAFRAEIHASVETKSTFQLYRSDLTTIAHLHTVPDSRVNIGLNRKKNPSKGFIVSSDSAEIGPMEEG